jgi:hypothetical protein
MFHTLPRLRHPVGDGLLPFLIMRRLLVGGEILLLPVDLVEHETSGIVSGLQHIKA